MSRILLIPICTGAVNLMTNISRTIITKIKNSWYRVIKSEGLLFGWACVLSLLFVLNLLLHTNFLH